MALNITVLNQVLLDETGAANIPWEYYLMLVIIAFLFFILSLYIDKNNDLTSIVGAIMFAIVTTLTPFVEFITTGFTSTAVGSSDVVYVASAAYHPFVPYVMGVMFMFFIVALLNVWKIRLLRMAEVTSKKKLDRGY